MHALKFFVVVSLFTGSATYGQEKIASSTRKLTTEDDLLAQLEAMPQIPSLTLDEMNVLCRNYSDPRFTMGSAPINVATLANARPELKQLPLQPLQKVSLSPEEAVALDVLSKTLREHLDKFAPRNESGERPTPDKLREQLLTEKSSGLYRWLRNRAIPTLNQMLMAEDTPYRLLLVELLSKIDTPDSTQALVQRAVFDVSSEVRNAAIEALQFRSLTDSRPHLTSALRHVWPRAAENAARAIVSLNAKSTFRELSSMLDQPDPQAPFARKDQSYAVHEMVRVKHTDCCLLCHPPVAKAGNFPSGAVPGVGVEKSGKLVNIASSRRLVNTSTSNGKTETPPYYKPSAESLLVRADISQLRQEFSVSLKSARGPERYDFVLRTRPLTKEESLKSPAQVKQNSYPQKDAVLFALRGLSKQDRGTQSDEWLKALPDMSDEIRASWLANDILANKDSVRALQQLKDSKGAAYTDALTAIMPRLNKALMSQARDALVERMNRMTVNTLRDKLATGSSEVRLAAAVSCSLRGDKALIPDLEARISKEKDSDVYDAVKRALDKLKRSDVEKDN